MTSLTSSAYASRVARQGSALRTRAYQSSSAAESNAIDVEYPARCGADERSGRPQVDDRVGAEGPPGLCRLGADAEPRQPVADTEVGGHPGVGVGERAHRDVLR